MSPAEITLITVAALLAGIVNAVAGGGTFLSFPALLATGVPPITANASNAVALWPGSLASAWAFRRELKHFSHCLLPLSVIAFLGGLGGGLLLLSTSNAAFTRLIPWLLLLATLLFAFSKPLSHLIRHLTATSARPGNHRMGRGGYAFQLTVSLYGGFFGAGMGILMLAALAIQGIEDINEINALKNWLSAVIYSVAVITFILASAISWPHTLIMLAAGTTGGYAGAALARHLPARWVRGFIIIVGTILTLYYFLTPS